VGPGVKRPDREGPPEILEKKKAPRVPQAFGECKTAHRDSNTPGVFRKGTEREKSGGRPRGPLWTISGPVRFGLFLGPGRHRRFWWVGDRPVWIRGGSVAQGDGIKASRGARRPVGGGGRGGKWGRRGGFRWPVFVTFGVGGGRWEGFFGGGLPLPARANFGGGGGTGFAPGFPGAVGADEKRDYGG